MAQIFVGNEDAGIIDDNIVGVQKTYSSSKIEARLGTKAGKAIGSSGKILIGDSEGNPVASTVTPADFALAGHNHDSTSIVLSTTNFGGVLNGSIDTVQELADFIDDNIGFGSKILTGTGVPSGVIGNKGDIYISNLGQIYLKDTGGNWQDTGVNIKGSTGSDGNDGIDGREIEITADATNIKWRYVGEITWNNIVALSLLKGNNGDPAPNLIVEYSINGSILWHTTFTTGDKWMRMSTDNGATYSTPAKFVGEDGLGSGDMLKSVYDTNNNGVIDNSEALNGQEGSYYLARANHTGTQTMSTISDAGNLATLDTVDTAQIDNDAVTFDKIENISQNHFLGRHSAGSGSTQMLSATQARSILNVEDGAEVNNISDVNATDLTDGGDTTLHTHDGRYYTETEVNNLLSGKANDADVVKTTGNQTIDGVKQFLKNIVVDYFPGLGAIASRIGRVTFLDEEATNGIPGGMSSEGAGFGLGFFSPSGPLRFFTGGKTNAHKRVEILTNGKIHKWGEVEEESFYGMRKKLLSSQIDFGFRFQDANNNELFRIRTANNDVAVGRNMKLAKDYQTNSSGTSNYFSIASRYERSGIPHDSQGHILQAIWGDSNGNPEGSWNDGGWGLQFGGTGNPYLKMMGELTELGRTGGTTNLRGNIQINGVSFSPSGGGFNPLYPHDITQGFKVVRSTSTTVPTGKVLYITHLLVQGGTDTMISVGGINMIVARYASSNYYLTLGLPIIVQSGVSVTSSSGSFFGFYCDGVANITPIQLNTSYTVPSGKTLAITSVNGANLIIGGVYAVLTNLGTGLIDISMNVLNQHIFVEGGVTVSPTSTNITGYLF